MCNLAHRGRVGQYACNESWGKHCWITTTPHPTKLMTNLGQDRKPSVNNMSFPRRIWFRNATATKQRARQN